MRFLWLLHNGRWSMRCVVYPPALCWTGELVCNNKARTMLWAIGERHERRAGHDGDRTSGERRADP
jgi:hypothetical protein